VMMNSRGWFVILYLGALSLGLCFGGRHAAFGQTSAFTCEQAREVVAKIGRESAERLARANGFTDEQIAEAARQCFKGHHHTIRRER
jgi:hypothetical protein